jgi:transposase-like protein
MTIATRKEQILRIKQASFQSELTQEIEQHIRERVIATVKSILEAALVEELKAEIEQWSGPLPRRSGYFERTTDTLYGRIIKLLVPKLRWGNKKRQWRILKRRQRAMTGLLDWAAYLYVMGLSLRDLQEALYFLLGNVISRSAVNRITLRLQEEMEAKTQTPITATPPILIVDGVWVDIQYTLDQFKVDRAGHQRQCREAQERVILAAMAIWPDGSYQLLHFEIAEDEDETTWTALFDHLIARGLDPDAVQLVVSDGTKGLLATMKARLPQAQQQRCITHKVRGMKRYLTYQNLPETETAESTSDQSSLKAQRWAQIREEAHAIYEAKTYQEAQLRLETFTATWQPLEPKAVHAFLWGIKRTFVFYQFDTCLHIRIRTTNLLERVFREFRTKADEIGAFPNEISCLTVFFLVVQRDHAKHGRPFSMAKIP